MLDVLIDVEGGADDLPDLRTLRKLPSLPAWLQAIVDNVSKVGMSWLEEQPKQVRDIYDIYNQAHSGNGECACAMAEMFEVGEMPGGASLANAEKWYVYAANIGSARAAYRMAVLQAWQSPEEPLASLDMTMLALQNITKNRRAFRFGKFEGLNLAINIVLHALEKGMVDDGNIALEQLMQMDDFCKHPDFERIAASLRKISSRRMNAKLDLVVVNKKISEDGDFKAGIYRQLEKPLPLVPVPANVDEIQSTLDLEFPWFASINALVCRQLMAAQFGSKPGFRIRPLLLAGLPGVGKTTWVKRLAELCEVPFRAVMAAGNSDAMFLRGTPRGWATSRPGAVLQAMVTEGVANPLFLVDEIEKASPDNRNGRLWDVLLQLLEPSSAKTYLDECLQVPSDLSWVSWIATANELGEIPKPLLERFTIVMVDSPGKDHFETIVKGSVARYAKEMGIDQRMLPSLSVDDMDVLQFCKSPREISRTVTIMLEQSLVSSKHARYN